MIYKTKSYIRSPLFSGYRELTILPEYKPKIMMNLAKRQKIQEDRKGQLNQQPSQQEGKHQQVR